MFHKIYPTDWHQLFLVAAGFLTTILLVWSQHWVRSFYEEQAYDTRPESDRRFTTHTMRLWLIVGVAFALCAFALTGIDWLFTRQSVQLCPAACQIGPMERLAAGFLMGAFDIALIGVLLEIYNAGRVIMTGGRLGRIDYTSKKKKCISIAACLSLFLILVSCLLPTFISPSHWLWLILGSFIIPLFIFAGTYAWASYRQMS